MSDLLSARVRAAIEEIVGGRDILLAVVHGSHLYGVAGPDSDIDIKVVFLPTEEEILLGQVAFAIDGNPESHIMGSGDVDIQAYSLMRYISMLGHFEPAAVEMLFAAANPDFVLSKDPRFALIEDAAPGLIGRGRLSLTSHARANLGRFSPDHADHIAQLGEIHDLLGRYPVLDRLRDHPDLIRALAERDRCGLALHNRSGEKLKNSQIPAQVIKSGGAANATLFVNLRGRLIDVGQTIQAARLDIETLKADVSRKRAKAEKLGDLGPKPVYHALRLLSQTREYHETGALTFPRPDAPLLRSVRDGTCPEDEIASMSRAYFGDVRLLEETGFRAPQDIDKSCGLSLVKALHRGAIAHAA